MRTNSANQVSVDPLSDFHQSSPRSWIGLCAVSFFLAEVNGVTMPFVNTYLQERGWRYDSIGAVTAIAGLTVFLLNLPAGFLIDRIHNRRALLIATALLVGLSIGLLPFVPPSAFWVVGLMVLSAMGQPFFIPLINALTLGMVGHERMDRSVGVTQAWNHAGNIAAALAAMILVTHFPESTVFLATAIASILAAGAVMLIRSQDSVEIHKTSSSAPLTQPASRFRDLFSDRRVPILLASAALFHLANAPVMPLVAQKIRLVGGSYQHVAAVVLVAQTVMVPTAILAGLWGPRFGRKWVLGVGFIALPIRILFYALTDHPNGLVALQAFDGIGAGIYDVTAIALCADLTRGRGHFNALGCSLAAAASLGAVVGPLIGGLIIQHFGFTAAFFSFAILGAAGATLFIGWMPATTSHLSGKQLQVCSVGSL